MNLQHVESPRRVIAEHLAAYYSELACARDTPQPRFSLRRTITAMATGGLRDGTEREVCGSAALIRGADFDPYRVTIPWSAMIQQRDMTSAGVSGSNFLVGTATPTAANALRPWSVSLQAGVTLFENLRENLPVPSVSGDVTGSWLAADGSSAITPADPTLVQRPMTPKTWGGIVEFSHTFLRMSEQAEAFIRQQLLRVAGRALDRAVLGGSGVDGEPQGLVNVPGVTISGASLDNADVLAMHEAVATAGANDARVAWVADPDVRELLAAREAVTTSGRMLWQDDKIDNRAAYATPDAPAATLFLADFSSVAIGLWGPGISIQINPYSDFSKGIIAARVLLDCDVAVLQTGALQIATGVT